MSARLRELALKSTPENLGLAQANFSTRPWGAVVDIARADSGIMTIACMADGSTSLYFSLGGGIVGAGRAESVRMAARLLLDRAAVDIPSMRATATTSTPSAGQVAFYVLATGGPFHASERESVLREGASIYSPMYRAANTVAGAVRDAETSGALK